MKDRPRAIEARDLARYAAHLADRNSHALGFLPRTAYERAAEKHQLAAAWENDELCGYLLHGWKGPRLKIYQACIQYDSRRIEHGTDLVRGLIQIANDANMHRLSLWCAEDLDANAFWAALGFSHTATRVKRTRKRRPHRRWELLLPAGRAHLEKLNVDGKEQQRQDVLKFLGRNKTHAASVQRIIRARLE